MSDYQAIYDAVRSRISGCDVGSVVADELILHSNLIGSEVGAVRVVNRSVT